MHLGPGHEDLGRKGGDTEGNVAGYRHGRKAQSWSGMLEEPRLSLCRVVHVRGTTKAQSQVRAVGRDHDGLQGCNKDGETGQRATSRKATGADPESQCPLLRGSGNGNLVSPQGGRASSTECGGRAEETKWRQAAGGPLGQSVQNRPGGSGGNGCPRVHMWRRARRHVPGPFVVGPGDRPKNGPAENGKCRRHHAPVRRTGGQPDHVQRDPGSHHHHSTGGG